MTDRFAVLDGLLDYLERYLDVNELREARKAFEVIQRGRESLRFELQGLEVIRLRDNAYLLERAEAAERKLAALSPKLEAAFDVLRKALEGEAG